MSNELTIIDTDTRIGALKREAHWAVVLAATGGGLTFTWLWHLMDWMPLSFAIHGITGVVGGYLVGTGVSRALTGMRARPWLRRYEAVSNANRVLASGLRVLFGAGMFYLSYLWAVGVEIGTGFTVDPAMLGVIMPVGIWGVILLFVFAPHVVRAMR